MNEFSQKQLQFLLKGFFSERDIDIVKSMDLDDLSPDELNEYFIASIGYFEVVTHYLDLTVLFEKLQILIKTGETEDKLILADEFKCFIFEELKDSMEKFLQNEWKNYKENKYHERLYDAGYTSETCSHTGETLWYPPAY